MLQNSLQYFLADFLQGIQNNPKLSFLYVENFLSWLTLYLTDLSKPVKYSVDFLLDDLEKEIRRDPKLKILRKFQIILEVVAGELVQGGLFRTWSETGTYHFSRQCKLYPERVKPEEMNKILCYDTREEAERKHRSCKTCLNADSSLGETDFLGDEPTG